MKTRKVYFSQPSCYYGKSVYFPYSAGVLASYSWQSEIIKEQCELGGFHYSLEPLDKAIKRFKNPWLIGFSNYMWNYEYNIKLCEELKKIYPDCVMIFGGHQIPNDTTYLEEYPFIDILIYDYGEIPFAKTLEALLTDGELEEVNNISFRNANGEIVKTPYKCQLVDDYPSPYLEGLFDSIIEDKPKDLSFSMLIEASRGCPNHCSYCDWGNLGTKVNPFSMKRVFDEISWMADKKIEFCYCTDSNLGILDRDEDIVDRVILSKETTGYPEKFQATFSKNDNEGLFRINKKLNDAGMSKGASLSLQTLSNEALENIGRRNMTYDKFVSLISKYNNANIAAYTELILGLPGETYESFRDGLCRLLEYGQHTSIYIFNCEVLTNSEMGQKEYLEKFNIRSVKTPLNLWHCESNNDTPSGKSDLIVQTYSMSVEDWRKMHLISNCIRAFHNLGYLQSFAIYLYYEKNISYETFYESLLEWMKSNPDSVAGKAFEVIEQTLDNVLEGKSALNYADEENFGNLLWPLEEMVFLKIAMAHELFYNEIEVFLKQYFDNSDKDNFVFGELIKYQKNVLKLPGRQDVTLEFENKYFDYFNRIYVNDYKPLVEEKNKMQITNSHIPSNWEKYAREVVWYGRRGGIIFNDKIKIK